MSGSIFVGVDTGATHTRVRAGDKYLSFPTPPRYSDYLAALSGVLEGLSAIDRVVIALPTVVEGQRMLRPPNLGPGWEEGDLRDDLRRAANIAIGEVVLVQDTEAAGYGVLHRDGPKALPSLLITLSSGLGGALLSESGVRPLEVGHMILDLSGRGAQCGCGQVGCVEADLSGFAITKWLATDPEEAPLTFWASYGELLGRFLCALAPLFLAKEILLMGGVSNQADQFLPTCRTWVREHVRRMAPPSVSVVANSDMVGAYGALVIAKGRQPTRGVLSRSKKGLINGDI